MNFFRAYKLLRTSLPFFKSVFRAYKQTVGTSKNEDGSIFSKYFSKVMTQSNLGAPPINQSKSMEEVEPRLILQRYYTLFKKNDPKIGGTTYLQSKVYAAKECLMSTFPDAAQHQKLFYKQVVEPEEQEEAKRAAQKSAEAQKAAEASNAKKEQPAKKE